MWTGFSGLHLFALDFYCFVGAKAPLSGADSLYQGEMSRRDKRGRDAGSRRLTERLYQICSDLSVSAYAEPPPLEGEALEVRTPRLPL